jgi:hypothetical protein
MNIKHLSFALLILVAQGDASPSTADPAWLTTLRLAPNVTVQQVARHLNNPRGVAVLPDGGLLVIEAGQGTDIPGEAVGTGTVLRLTDLNSDGDYDDPNERTTQVSQAPSYNSLRYFGTGHDEVFGLADIVRLPNDRVLYTQDDPFAEEANLDPEGGLFNGDVGIFEIIEGEVPRRFIKRSSTLNALAYDVRRGRLYVTESGNNRVIALDLAGNAETLIDLPTLAHGQQAVPSGLALDPISGELWVALFSGFIKDYYEGTVSLSYLPHDAQVVRVNPTNGQITQTVTGLTTAIDVALDERGNLYVIELTAGWPLALMPVTFDLYDPTLPPDPGGYTRFAGRLTQFPADGSPPIVLVEGFDTPTNLTYAAGVLYVSTGLGTPGRMILTPHGTLALEGALYAVAVGLG